MKVGFRYTEEKKMITIARCLSGYCNNADAYSDGINELVSYVIKCPEFFQKDYLGYLFYKETQIIFGA